MAKHSRVHEGKPPPASAPSSTDAVALSAKAQDAESAQDVAPATSPDSELDTVVSAPAPSEVPTPVRLQSDMSRMDEMLDAAEDVATVTPASTLRTVDASALHEMGGELRPVLSSNALDALQMSASTPEIQFPTGPLRAPPAGSCNQHEAVEDGQYGEPDVPNLARARRLAKRASARWAHALQLKAWYSWVDFAFEGPEHAVDADPGPRDAPPHSRWTPPRSMQERADILRQGQSQSALTFYAGLHGETQDAQIVCLQRELEKLKLDMRKSMSYQAVQEDEIRQLQQEVIEARRREAEAQKVQAEYAARFQTLLGAFQDVEGTLLRAANGARSQSAILRILRSIHCEKI